MRHGSEKQAWRKIGFRGTLILGVLTIAVWFLFLLSDSDPVEGETSTSFRTSPKDPTSIAVARVVTTDLALQTEATGYLRAWRETELRAQTSGRIVDLPIDEGDWVKEGAPLLRFESEEPTIALAEAQAELLKTRADFAVRFLAEGAKDEAPSRDVDMLSAAQKALDRAERQHREGLLSEEKLRVERNRFHSVELLLGGQRSEIQAATAGLTQAEQRLKRAELNLARTSISAPFSGRVADLSAEIGELVSTGELCLLLIDDSRFKVDVEVLEADLIWLQKGAPARVRIPSLDDRVFDGAIHSINPRIDEETGTGRVTVALANPENSLIAGLFALVELQTRQLRGKIVVPREALLERQGRELVFVIEDEIAKWRYVETGVRSQEMIEIVSGLEAGQLVAVEGHFALADHSRVETRESDSL